MTAENPTIESTVSPMCGNFAYQVVYNGLDYSFDDKLNRIIDLDESSGHLEISASEEDLVGLYELDWIIYLEDYPNVSAQITFEVKVNLCGDDSVFIVPNAQDLTS